MSKTDCHLLRQKVCQRISVIKKKTLVFFKRELKCQFSGITEILWRIYWRNNWRSIFDIVNDSSFWAQIMHGRDGVLLVQKSMDTSQYFQNTMIFLSLKSHNCDISKLWWWKIEIINPFGYICRAKMKTIITIWHYYYFLCYNYLKSNMKQFWGPFWWMIHKNYDHYTFWQYLTLS